MNATPAVAPINQVLTRCLHLLLLALLALAATRAVTGGQPQAAAVTVVAVLCAAVYALGPLSPRVRSSRVVAARWMGAVTVAWLVLVVLTPDGVWVAFPLYFLQLHLLPRRAGLVAVSVTALVAIAAFAAHQGTFSPAAAIGPALGAAVAVAVVWGYQALYRENEQRRRLIEELTATRADLAAAQHDAGVLAERERLAREIHDTLAQGLSSIQLLLRAAGRALPDTGGKAAGYVEQARQAAVDNLAEARRFVAAHTPPALDGTTLAGAVARLCSATPGTRFHLDGDPVALPIAHEVALLRIAQAALANTVRHANATTAAVTLSHLDDEVALEIADDGVGFDPSLPFPDGFGLAAMRSRARALGGSLTVRSAPGEGAVLTARLPLARS
ncbi:sensor histidine kinase [Lentzea sp. NBRC 102530]|uniref:sensor histidine kinase n=1 Tax=Lentzea sp. NBRC 102530 TaxID=3032201 RepID=UPI0024A441E0|nr:sensor histidine kinase [Lentzea sp. NBRC 102530]GLY47264.1 two-component sensor histidine kinase [Lentzea sp. NBRC 102530]